LETSRQVLGPRASKTKSIKYTRESSSIVSTTAMVSSTWIMVTSTSVLSKTIRVMVKALTHGQTAIAGLVHTLKVNNTAKAS